MIKAFSTENLPWEPLRGLPGARTFEYKPLIGSEYTGAFSAELVRIAPGDQSVPHVESGNHAFFVLSGTGELSSDDQTWPVGPGSVCLVSAGERHLFRNAGADDLVVLVIYDPPRARQG